MLPIAEGALWNMASMSLIEMESPNDEDLLKAPRSRPLWLATRQLQLLLSSDKFYGFEDLTAQTIGSDATAVVTPTKHKRKSLKVMPNLNIYSEITIGRVFVSHSISDWIAFLLLPSYSSALLEIALQFLTGLSPSLLLFVSKKKKLNKW